MKRVLIVDDERGSRESLKAVFDGAYQVLAADGATGASALLARHKVDLLLLDVMMPGKSGIEFLREAQDRYPDLPVIMVSASNAVRPVVEAMRQGAYDFVTKPFDVAEIRRLAARAMANSDLHRRVQNLQEQIASEFPIDAIVGDSRTFRQALTDAQKAAGTDATVLITGESGTGKELVARLIHATSARSSEPFVPVHCGALPETLMESELFGHERGAFTNAERMKPGRFDLAGSGTLFFDEVSEMTMATQVKLLRVLQEREFMRVGGTKVIRTEARILAATNVDLRAAAAEGRFRSDLYYRLGVVPIHLPPLRERREDIPKLADHFLSQFRPATQATTDGFDGAAVPRLLAYHWPGNIRELRNVVERMLVLHGKEERIRASHLPREFQDAPRLPVPGNGARNLTEAVNAFEREMVRHALEEADGVQTKAAELLGTTRRILRYRMDKLNISVPP